VASAEAAAAELLTDVRASAAEALSWWQSGPAGNPAGIPSAEMPAVVPAEGGPAATSSASDQPPGEAAALARISPFVSRLAPAEPWVHTTGRTVAEATDAALAQLGVTEAGAEIEVVAKGSPWRPARVEIRARIRSAEDCA
jgi:hypothetical protein